MKQRRRLVRFVVGGVLGCATALTGFGWGYEGHRIVNQLGLASLPEDYPAWARTPEATDRILFLAGEPDRTRNNPEPGFQHGTYPEHYIDVEWLPRVGIDPRKLTPFRYEFAVAFANGRAAHLSEFPPVVPAQNNDHTREWPGFSPWAVFENYARLQSAFSYLRTFETFGGTSEEIAHARANVIYIMGTMGHYVGDMAQPLHTTEHHNGWVGPNPNGFTVDQGFHAWIDSGFMRATGLGLSDVIEQARPAQQLPGDLAPDGRPRVFLAVVDYLLAQHDLVVPVYQLEKDGAFKAENPASQRGRDFIKGQWLTAGEMLGSLWITAYRAATPDIYLRTQLETRAGKVPAQTPAPPPAPTSPPAK